METDILFKVNKSTIVKLRCDEFCLPNPQYLLGYSQLKSKAEKCSSIASEETRDEEFPDQDPERLPKINKQVFNKILPTKSQKNSRINTTKRRVVKTKSLIILRSKVQETCSEL